MTKSISLDQDVAGKISGITANTVNVLNNNAKIQDGVTLASSGGIVNVAAGTYKENVMIDKSLSVKGSGADNTIVDGQQADSVFTVGNNSPNVDVLLTGMTIQNGSASTGGGINNYGRLTVTDSTISGNTALNNGGGISNSGTLTVTNSLISGNTATWNGGGVWNNNSILKVMNSNVSNNVAGWHGGGIENWMGTVDVTGSIISRNSGLYGGGFSNDWGTVTISGSTISENQAYTAGGILNDFGNMTVKESTIVENNAFFGGGIGNGGTATISGSNISGNAGEYGGGIYNELFADKLLINGTSQITNNQAAWGGGIYSDIDTVTLDGTNVGIKSNKAKNPPSESSWYQGWGVYLETGIPTTANGFDPVTQVTGNTII